jgi:hypothetical protein
VPYYGAYHPPVVVNTYSTGCYNCGGWSAAGAAVTGVVVGAAIASANNNAAQASAYNQGYAAASTTSAANTNAAVANANAAAANANAAAANANYAAASASSARSYSMGEIVAAVPGGCATPNVHGTTYYLCGNTWFSPSYGANGVFYRVVPAP